MDLDFPTRLYRNQFRRSLAAPTTLVRFIRLYSDISAEVH
jgi:hypothetical protein